MSLLSIFRQAGAAVIRTPLLWFFSTVIFFTNDLPSTIPELGCITFLFFPIIVIAEAGQIRSIQLSNQGTPTSISQIFKHGLRKLGPLIVVWIISLLLAFLLMGILVLIIRLVTQQVISSDMTPFIIAIGIGIAYPFMALVKCAIVISGLSLRSCFIITKRVVQKGFITILTILIIFCAMRIVLISVIYPLFTLYAIPSIIYLLINLLFETVQPAVFTFAYMYYIGDTPRKNISREIYEPLG